MKNNWNERQLPPSDFRSFCQELGIQIHTAPLPTDPPVDYLALADVRSIVVNSRLAPAPYKWAAWTAALILEGFSPARARIFSICAIAPRAELERQDNAGFWLETLGFTSSMIGRRLTLYQTLHL